MEEEATELTVLTEIRDLLQQGATADSAGKHVSRLAPEPTDYTNQ